MKPVPEGIFCAVFKLQTEQCKKHNMCFEETLRANTHPVF